MSPSPDSADLDWTDDGAPRSRQFDDIYFSAADGLAESRAVFLRGCGLPEAWAGRDQFTVGELGFGTGLNVLALLDAWRGARTAGQRLSIFSVEAFPLSAEQAARALAAWPELADLSAELLRQWPRRTEGFHRLDFPGLGASLDLAIGDVGWALDQWTGLADAWFLDGFAPARNPGMWREAVLAAVAARSAPGARLATFTVAREVRRGLGAQGFQVDKRPGHGRKRERLEGRLDGTPPLAPFPRVAVIGAGIAGAALARALAAQGLRPLVFEAETPGAGASGNPVALVTPALDAGGGARARFYAQAFARAVDLYRALGPEAVIGQGSLQLERGERDPPRFAAVAASGVFEPDLVRRIDAADASRRVGARQDLRALLFAEGLSIRPDAVLTAWLDQADLRRAKVAKLTREGETWVLRGPNGALLAEVDAVCVAAGLGAAALASDLPLAPVRGQTSWTTDVTLGCAVAWSGYAAPFDGGLLFGATHDRERSDAETLPSDHGRNLQLLAEVLPDIASRIAPDRLRGRAGVRMATPDRMPVAGPLPAAPGLYVLTGQGSRGFTTAPILAEHLAALIRGAPSPLPRDQQRLVGAERFGAG
jgi:tRNA 5-methylaminomethyl-2-thiouridine biosynthesis bifunctional protein